MQSIKVQTPYLELKTHGGAFNTIDRFQLQIIPIGCGLLLNLAAFVAHSGDLVQ
jgi:hypothetical protein